MSTENVCLHDVSVRKVKPCPAMNTGTKSDDPHEKTVYHTTIALDAVCKEGLKTQEMLLDETVSSAREWKEFAGIGAVNKTWIFTTANPQTAADFATDIETLVRIARGEFDLDTIKDHLDAVDDRAGMTIRPSALWEKIKGNPAAVCLDTRVWSRWGRELGFDAEEIRHLEDSVIKKRGFQKTRRQWQYDYPKKEGYPEIVFPTKSDGRTNFAYVRTTNADELRAVTRKMVFDIFTKCYSPIRPRLGGAVDMSQNNENLHQLAQIDLDNVGIVQATAILPEPYHALRAKANWMDLPDYRARSKWLVEWDKATGEKPSFYMQGRGNSGDWGWEEVSLHPSRLKDMHVVEITRR